MQNCGICCPGWLERKTERRELKDKYQDLARELKKKLWNRKVTIITIVIGSFGTVTKRLRKGLKDLKIRERRKTIQNTALLRSARILRRVLKKLWIMKVTIVPILIGALGTITKWLSKGLEELEVGGRVETIQTTALLRTARILRRVLETWGDLLSLKLHWKTIS